MKNKLYKFWRVVLWCFVFIWVIFIIPNIIKFLRPDLITQMESMLRSTEFSGCSINIERDDDESILVIAKTIKGIVITTEASKYSLKEISKTDQEIFYFAHTINQHPNGTFYLTQTQIWADADLKQARRIAVEYCDLIENPDGRVSYHGHVPVYQCAVPVKRATCNAISRARDRVQ